MPNSTELPEFIILRRAGQTSFWEGNWGSRCPAGNADCGRNLHREFLDCRTWVGDKVLDELFGHSGLGVTMLSACLLYRVLWMIISTYLEAETATAYDILRLSEGYCATEEQTSGGKEGDK
jgi:hypothetical protein